MLKNPFFTYVGTFGLVLLLYELDWSDIYPPTSLSLLLFLSATFLAAIIFGVLIQPLVASATEYSPGLLNRYTGILVIATFAGEIALSGGIPLLRVIAGEKFFNIEADATHLHAFVLWTVYGVIRFADFLYTRRFQFLAEAALPVLFYGLMVYRGPALICLITYGFLILIRFRLQLHHYMLGALTGIFLLFLNGVLGDIRSPGQEQLGSPSVAFQESGIPATFFWSYLYATLGMANFQLSIDKLPPDQGSVSEFIGTELLPDTISKRLLPHLNPKIQSGQGNLVTRDQLYSWEQPQVSPGLNVSTIYGRSYGYFGWLGVSVMFAVLSFFIVCYLLLMQRSPYQAPCLALLNTMVVLCLFNNMIASAAMFPLLVLPLVLPPWSRKGVTQRANNSSL